MKINVCIKRIFNLVFLQNIELVGAKFNNLNHNYFTFVSEDSTQEHLKIARSDVWP